MFYELWELYRVQTAKVTFKVTTLEMTSSTHSKDMVGVKFKKNGSHDPDHYWSTTRAVTYWSSI